MDLTRFFSSLRGSTRSMSKSNKHASLS
uniref:Uncharacterized protein n=1 Tax=Arundo donax TaxID=35708 RepID=A0A0A9B0V2_ARUDO